MPANLGVRLRPAGQQQLSHLQVRCRTTAPKTHSLAAFGEWRPRTALARCAGTSNRVGPKYAARCSGVSRLRLVAEFSTTAPSSSSSCTVARSSFSTYRTTTSHDGWHLPGRVGVVGAGHSRRSSSQSASSCRLCEIPAAHTLSLDDPTRWRLPQLPDAAAHEVRGGASQRVPQWEAARHSRVQIVRQCAAHLSHMTSFSAVRTGMCRPCVASGERMATMSRPHRWRGNDRPAGGARIPPPGAHRRDQQPARRARVQ